MIDKEKRHEECHMKEKCVKYDKCPMVLVQKIVSGKWKILILWYLSYNTLRFNDIKKRLPHVTQKMLTQQLRSLEEDNLIFRKVYAVVPPKVEYGLTEVGKEIIPILEMMHGFGAKYLEQVYDKENNVQ
ncbi:transcriptional regulator, HxlR family [Desulfofarcimen acetoxidans DSM 771]|jgi:DNA-binding HxlR family transcriptional regulator|uniref:Transcriptional regulator, HxlR family n=1 Tax=Desulfofarcimen acetoxidans (strain ATCC 49208 / DSM 771 / KCTC 5769 / VKM B-1644 / 5575) TaxID=485916 RepID=C8W517_DESAS|nr:helix-turn-helix domain-containing protein [Desulfofarcimen acetoxidans]ACV61369.1 transcriptional regulator, HxlR family [Desulfofarcimen acetoxidans DSM 771]